LIYIKSRSLLPKSPKIITHKNTIVKEIIGKDKLSGIRLLSKEGTDRKDILVEGIFLEIGLVPNSGSVKELIELNERGEIPVDCAASTSVPGFFAAGDVTSIPEKQISIAVGDGAKAALSAHKYLHANNLTKSKIKVGE
jgi:alkyl hydroperoxide reductase subunit F